jgi:hypothetical protein
MLMCRGRPDFSTQQLDSDVYGVLKPISDFASS